MALKRWRLRCEEIDEMKNQYETISNEFQQARQMPVTRFLEVPSVIQAVNPIKGKSVIDLACGEGFYTRIWKRLGADRVFGLDLAPEMIALAEQQEKAFPLGIRYIVSDASKRYKIGRFDIATAIFLFNYASDVETLFMMIENVFINLENGGRLIAVVPNPNFVNDRKDTLPYGYFVEEISREPSSMRVEMTFTGDKPFSIEFTQWAKAIYEKTLSETGFGDISWSHFKVSDEGMKNLGSEFWRSTLENPKSIILTAVKR
jgi:SAM-dependent methyltransferase